MGLYNFNSGYGQALFQAVASAVPNFGRVFVVVPNTDPGFQTWQELVITDPEGQVRLFTSLADAYNATTSNNNDVIVLASNATHQLTEMLTVAKNRVHFVGIDGGFGIRKYGQGAKVNLGVTAAATDIATLLVTGVRCTFHNIKFINNNTVAQGIYAVVDGGEYTVFKNCEIYKATDLDVTGAADLVANGDSSHYEDCYIGTTVDAIVGAVIRPCVNFSRGLAGAGKVARDVTFKNCILARRCGNTANRYVYGAEANAIERMGLFENCVFWNAALASAVPAQNVAFGATQTDGSVLLNNCAAINADTAMSTTTGVFVNGSVPAAGTTGIAVQAS